MRSTTSVLLFLLLAGPALSQTITERRLDDWHQEKLMNSQEFEYEKLPNFPIGIGAEGHNHNDLADEPVAIGIHQALKTLLIL